MSFLWTIGPLVIIIILIPVKMLQIMCLSTNSSDSARTCMKSDSNLGIYTQKESSIVDWD